MNNAPTLGIDLAKAKVAVVGATEGIGSAVRRWWSSRTGVGELLLVARQQQPLLDLQAELGGGRILTLEEALPGRCRGLGGKHASYAPDRSGEPSQSLSDD